MPPLNYLAVARIELAGSFSALWAFNNLRRAVESLLNVDTQLSRASKMISWDQNFLFDFSIIQHFRTNSAPSGVQSAGSKTQKVRNNFAHNKLKNFRWFPLSRMAWIMNDSFTMNQHEKSSCSGLRVAPDSHHKFYLLVKHFSFRP